jgi:hypothetical protein
VDALKRYPTASRRDPRVEAWFEAPDRELRRIVRPWFDQMRACGEVRELITDGHPVACAGHAAFAYVDAFAAHAAVGFFYGAELPDPARLLEGAGKRMRHVKLRWGKPADAAALGELIAAAWADIQARTRLED